jgi:hypothetical protein
MKVKTLKKSDIKLMIIIYIWIKIKNIKVKEIKFQKMIIQINRNMLKNKEIKRILLQRYQLEKRI